MGPIQRSVNQLLGISAAVVKGKQLLDKKQEEADFKNSLNQIKLSTAQEGLKKAQLQNKYLRMKNKAFKQMQEAGSTKVETKDSFSQFLDDLRNQGVAEKYINERQDYLKEKYKELNKK